MLQAINISHLQLRNFFCYLLLFSAIYSAFLLSVSMIALVVLSLIELRVENGKIHFPFRASDCKRALQIMAYPSFAVLLLFFVVSAFRFYPIGDLDYLLTRLRIKVPFLVFPFVFLALPRFTKKDLQHFFYFFLVMIALTSGRIIITYLSDYEYYNELIQQGQH
ncbi:MAG: hypothetical protein AAGJ93_17625, partial [Bacteroidota bacterium]